MFLTSCGCKERIPHLNLQSTSVRTDHFSIFCLSTSTYRPWPGPGKPGLHSSQYNFMPTMGNVRHELFRALTSGYVGIDLFVQFRGCVPHAASASNSSHPSYFPVCLGAGL